MNFLHPKAYFVDTGSPTEPWLVLRPAAVHAAGRIRFSRTGALILGFILFGILIPASLYNLLSARGAAALLATAAQENTAEMATFSLPETEPRAPAPELLGTIVDVASEPKEEAFAPAVSSAATNPTLRIPQIGLVMPIVEGSGENALYQGAWRSPWSSTPDAGGNTVLFGHRFLHLPPHPNTMFRLDEVNLGETFELTWEGRAYTYRIDEIKIVEPTDVSVLRQTNSPTVTLITCTPKFTTAQRLVVHATRL